MRARLGLVAAVAVALVTTACGGGSGGASTDGSDTDLTAFQSAVKSASAPVEYAGPTSGPTPATGKKIGVVTCAAAAVGCARIAAGVQAAGKVLGWQVSVFDGEGQASTQNSAVLQAISQGADAIVLAAVKSRQLGSGMAAARRANIPVVSAIGDNEVGSSGTDVFADVDGQSSEIGKMLANYVVVNSKGAAKYAVFQSPEFGTLRPDGFNSVASKCSSCTKVLTQDYNFATAINDVPSQVQSVLQAHPDINYLFVDIGQFGALAVKQIDSLNLKGQVQVVSSDCNADDLTNIRDADVQSACGAIALNISGWQAMNELVLAFAGQPQDDPKAPIRLFTKGNAPSGSVWDGDYDPATEFGKLWGKS